MKSLWMCEEMNINWKVKDGSPCGMRPNHPLHSKNSRRVLHRQLKNRWRKEISRQFIEELNEYERIKETA